MILTVQKYDTYGTKVWYLRYKSKILTVSILNFNTERLNSEYWILKNTSVKYVLNTYDNYLYIISLYSFLIALYIKDVKPISSASAVQKHTIFQTVLYSEIMKNAGYQGWLMKEIEFLNTKEVLLQKHLVILHLLVEFALIYFNVYI